MEVNTWIVHLGKFELLFAFLILFCCRLFFFSFLGGGGMGEGGSGGRGDIFFLKSVIMKGF